MATGQVGRLSVRVLPDTTRFREDLQRALTRAERTMSASIEVTAELSQRSLANIKRQLEGLDATIDADVDTDSTKARIESVLAGIDTRMPISAVQSEEFQAELEALRKSVEAVDAEVPISPNLYNTYRVRARLQHLTRPRLIHTFVDLNKASYTRVATALAALGGLRAVNDLRRQFGEITKNIDRFTGIAGTIAPLLAVIGAGLTAAAGSALTLGGSLASIIPTLLAFPGILVGAGVGLGVLIAAMQDFTTVLADLGPAYSNLQTIISNNFWAKAEAPIRNLALTALPMLEDGLGKTATSLGNFFSIMADTLARPKNIDLLGASFGFLSEAIGIAAKGIEPLTNAIIQLGTVGMSYMPALATAFNGVAESFENWVSSSVESGQMFVWIDTGIQALKDLGRVVGNTFGILTSLHRAASLAGGPGLGDLADGLGRVNEALQGRVWQGALTTIFLAANQAIRALGPGVSALGDAFISMAPTIGQVMVLAGQLVSEGLEAIATVFQQPAFQGGLLDFFEGLLGGADTLSAAMPGIGDTIGAVMSTMGDLAAVIGPVLGTAFQAMGPIVQDLMGIISAIAPVIGEVLVGAIELLAPYVQQIVSAIADWVAENPELAATILAIIGAAGALIGVVISIISTIALVVGSILSVISTAGTLGLTFGGVSAAIGSFIAIAAKIGAVVGIIVAALVSAWNSSEAFRNTIISLGESIWGVIQSIGQGLVSFVSGVASGLGPFITGLVDIFGALMGIIAPIAEFLMSIFGPALATVGTFFMDLMGIVGTLIGGVLTALGQALSVIADLLTGDFAGAWEGFLSLITGLGEMLESIVQQLFEMGVNLVQGLWEGILSAADGLIALISGWVQGLIDTVKSLFGIASPSTIFMAMGVDLILGLIQGIVSMLGALISAAVSLGTQLLTSIIGFVTNIANGIRTGFNNARIWAVTAISTLVSGVVSFFANLVGRIVSFVTNIASSVRSGFNNARSAAVSAISTLVSRVVSFFANLVGRIASFVSNIASRVRSGFNNARSAAVSAISTLVSRVISFFSRLYSSIISRVSSIRSSIQSGFNAAKQIAISAFQALVSGVISKIGTLLSQVRALPGKIKSGLGNLGSLLYGAGKNVIQGLINGIKNMASKAVGAAKGVVGDAVNGAKNLLGISSPSKVFMKIGAQTGEGMVIGLERQTHAVTNAMQSMVQPPSLPDVDRGTIGEGRSGYGETNLYVQAPNGNDPATWGRRLKETLDLNQLQSTAGGI